MSSIIYLVNNKKLSYSRDGTGQLSLLCSKSFKVLIIVVPIESR